VAKSSIMFKNIKDVFYKLIKAEKVVRKALIQKGLFLDQKDFNIMEIFNSAYGNYSEDYDSEYSERDKEQEHSYVQDAWANGGEKIEKLEKEEYNSIPPLQLDANEHRQKPQLPTNNFELSPVEPSGTPNSQNFDKFPLSQKSHKSNLNFVSRSSNRLLFADYQVEKRPLAEKQAKPKKDFLWTCNHRNNLLAFYPIHELQHLKLNPYLWEISDSDDSQLSESDLMRSISMPIASNHELEEKLIEPLSLERQPFSNLINFTKPTHNYWNPLDKVDLKRAFSEKHNFFAPHKFAERSFEDDSLGMEDENMQL
jgi:hypothetical protein